jgi:GNAT superfamily N-acetyltransferase
MDEWRFEHLNDSHERGEFCCGKPPLDNFLRSLVTQYEKRKLGRTFVAVVGAAPRVWGYYTLAASAVAFEHLPRQIGRKLPKHPIPTVLLGRLAVDKEFQGRGMGADLLVDALHRSVQISSEIGIFAVEVMAIDEEARQFYIKHNFISFEDNEFRLFLPLKSIEGQL